MTGITPSVRARMDELKDYIRAVQKKEHGKTPSRSEMGEHFGVSNSVVNRWLYLLVKVGEVEIPKGMARTVRIKGLREVSFYACPETDCPSVSVLPSKCNRHNIDLEATWFREM